MNLTACRDLPPRRWSLLDRPVLVSNIVAGAIVLAPVAVLSWPLTVVGVAYVVVTSVFLAAVYARTDLRRRQETAAWVAPWLVSLALWTWVATGIDGGSSSGGSNWLLNAWFGLLIATPSYLGWQAVALVLRHLFVWRSSAPEGLPGSVSADSVQG